jgi:adenylate cyclase
VFGVAGMGTIGFVLAHLTPGRQFAVAVLPFDASNLDERETAFSAALNDDLSSRLARMDSVRVAASASSLLIATAGDRMAAARAQGIDAVIQGRVSKEGGVVRVSATLVGASTGAPLWSATYRHDPHHRFRVHDQIAADVVRTIHSALRTR